MNDYGGIVLDEDIGDWISEAETVTKEELQMLFDGLNNTQKEEVEKIFQKRRDRLFEWYDAEREKAYKKLKEDGRYKTGLDANSNEPEVRELSAEYKRRYKNE